MQKTKFICYCYCVKQIKDHFAVFLGLPLAREDLSNHKIVNEYKVLDTFNFDNINYIEKSVFQLKNYLTKYKVEPKYFLKQNDILIKFRANLEIIYVHDVKSDILIPANYIVIRSPNNENQLRLWYLLNNKYKKLLLSQFNANSRTTYLSIGDIGNIEINDDLLSVKQTKIDLYISLQRYKKLSDMKKELITKQVHKILEGEQ